jgi:hypothetical protein
MSSRTDSFMPARGEECDPFDERAAESSPAVRMVYGCSQLGVFLGGALRRVAQCDVSPVFSVLWWSNRRASPQGPPHGGSAPRVTASSPCVLRPKFLDRLRFGLVREG